MKVFWGFKRDNVWWEGWITCFSFYFRKVVKLPLGLHLEPSLQDWMDGKGLRGKLKLDFTTQGSFNPWAIREERTNTKAIFLSCEKDKVGGAAVFVSKLPLHLRWPCAKTYGCDHLLYSCFTTGWRTVIIFISFVNKGYHIRGQAAFIHICFIPCRFRVKDESLLKGAVKKLWATYLLWFKLYGQTFP